MQFFQKISLVANTVIEVVLKMLFLTLAKSKLNLEIENVKILIFLIRQNTRLEKKNFLYKWISWLNKKI